ncbi:unnamed protein product, partial [Choristocarpus tenellus]
EVTVLYVGNEHGDVLGLWLTARELDSMGCPADVPSQRRPNHNPYRMVRTTLRPDKADLSRRISTRAQKRFGLGQEARSGITAGTGRRALGRNKKGGSQTNCAFIAPAVSFQLRWAAHSEGISSIAWIMDPPSVLTASLDGLAAIWSPEGSTLLGQLDINNAHP